MEDTALSLLLEDLIQQNQIQWVESTDSDNNLYITSNENTPPDAMLDLFSVLPDEDSFSGSSDEITSALLTPTNGNVNTQNNKKRKRREMQKESEANRRMKFKEQLSMLRTLLCADQDAYSKQATREAVMSSAIQEILQLRYQATLNATTETDSILVRLGIGKVPMQQTHALQHNYSNSSLADPCNRTSYSTQDLERAFQTMFAREMEQCASTACKPEQTYQHSIQMLEDISKQIGKPEYQLDVGVLGQFYHSTFKFNPKELRKTLETNWNIYQSLKKENGNNLLLFANSEIGAWILSDMSMMEYLTGNFEAAGRAYNFAQQLIKKMQHHTTNRFLLATLALQARGGVTVSMAEKINNIVQHDYYWGPFGKLVLGSALIVNGQHKEGLDVMELSVSQIMDRLGQSVLCIVVMLLEAYIQTGNVDKGLRWVNYALKKSIDGPFGKAELVRLKANLVMMKKNPDYVPEVVQIRHTDYSIDDLVNLCESGSTTSAEQQALQHKPVFGPSASTMLQECFAESIDVGNEDVEMLLRSALNLAQVRGIHTIALRSAADLTQYFMFIGDTNQAMETVQIVKNCTAAMKGSKDSTELQRARHVVALVEC